MSSPAICIVGCGAIARVHVEVLRSLGASIEHVVGRNNESAKLFAQEHDIPTFSADLERALDEIAIDAVVVASPSNCHADQSRVALQRGHHVLVEIPMALDYAEAVDLMELSEKSQILLMPAHSERFIPSLAALKDQVSNGELELVHIIGRETAPRRKNVGWTGRERSWTDDLLWHFGGHAVDLAMWLVDANNVDVQSQSGRIDDETGVVMDIDIAISTPKQQLISISLSFNSHFSQHEYLFIGREASFHFDRGRMVDSLGHVDDPLGRGEDYYQVSWQLQNAEFLSAIQGRELSLSARDVLPAMRVLQEVTEQMTAMPGVTI